MSCSDTYISIIRVTIVHDAVQTGRQEVWRSQNVHVVQTGMTSGLRHSEQQDIV